MVDHLSARTINLPRRLAIAAGAAATVAVVSQACGARTGLDVPSHGGSAATSGPTAMTATGATTATTSHASTSTGTTGTGQAVCGNGIVEPGEQCDEGPNNSDRPAVELINGALTKGVRPVQNAKDPESFYDYQSASAHTGFEAVHTSNLFLYQQLGVAGLSLFTIHGIDLDATGQDDGNGAVNQTFSGLPGGSFVALADDNSTEFHMVGAANALGLWKFQHNTDGGIIGGIPFPGGWRIEIDSTFLQSVTSWRYVDGTSFIAIDAPTAILQAYPTPSACRTNCTIPRCGDGVLDGGEVCDDGNNVSGDGCSADCKTTD